MFNVCFYVDDLFAGKMLKVENASEFYCQASVHQAIHLKLMSADFIKKNLKVVMATSGWSEDLKNHQNLVKN